MTQKDLIEKSFLPRTTINRICRNKNDKGDGYKPTPRTVAVLCVALGLTKAEKNDLFEIAFPEMYLLDEILDRKMNLFDANIFLFEHDVEPLGRLE